VISTDGTAIAAADVICIPAYTKLFSPFDTPQAFRNQKSKDDGTFQIPHLPVGEYQVLAQKKGFKFAAMGEPIYPDGYNDIRNVDVVLTPVEGGQFSVYGRVTDPAGNPISGVRLSLNSFGTQDFSANETETSTDGQGSYTFRGIQSGVIVLRAEKEGYQGQNVGNVKLDQPTDIVLQAAAFVRGRVLVRETNQPPPEAKVVAMRTSRPGDANPGLGFMLEGNFERGTAGPDGTFEMQLSAGDYVLEARATGLTPGRTQFSVEAGQEIDGVVIYLRQAGGRIQGRVSVADGKSPAGALAWMTQDMGASSAFPNLGPDVQQNGVQVGADGAFDFLNLPAGVYTVQARLEGYAQGQSGPVQVGESQTVSGVEIVLTAGNALEGTVAFNGRPEPGATVVVYGIAGGVTEVTTSDATGHYRIERLPAGPYLATAVSLSAGLAGIALSQQARIEIVADTTTTFNFGEATDTALVGFCWPMPPITMLTKAFLLAPGASLDLTSIDVANLSAWLSDPGAFGNAIIGGQPVDRDGFFRIDNLVEGEYLLNIVCFDTLTLNMRIAYSGPVNVVSNQVTEIEVPLATSGG
jgi:hypothetical protein